MQRSEAYASDVQTLAERSKLLIGDNLYQIFFSYHNQLIELLNSYAEGDSERFQKAESELEQLRGKLLNHLRGDEYSPRLAS